MDVSQIKFVEDSKPIPSTMINTSTANTAGETSPRVMTPTYEIDVFSFVMAVIFLISIILLLMWWCYIRRQRIQRACNVLLNDHEPNRNEGHPNPVLQNPQPNHSIQNPRLTTVQPARALPSAG